MKKLIVKKYKDYKACFFVHFKESECYVKILNSNFYSKYSENYKTFSQSKSSDFLFLAYNSYGLIYLSRLSYVKIVNKNSINITNKEKLIHSIYKTDVMHDCDGEYLLKVHY